MNEFKLLLILLYSTKFFCDCFILIGSVRRENIIKRCPPDTLLSHNVLSFCNHTAAAVAVTIAVTAAAADNNRICKSDNKFANRHIAAIQNELTVKNYTIFFCISMVNNNNNNNNMYIKNKRY